jgi:hypothetical protein
MSQKTFEQSLAMISFVSSPSAFPKEKRLEGPWFTAFACQILRLGWRHGGPKKIGTGVGQIIYEIVFDLQLCHCQILRFWDGGMVAQFFLLFFIYSHIFVEERRLLLDQSP